MADDRAAAGAEEDLPRPLEPGLPPEVASPLAPFAGAVPERPAWFSSALAREPERRRIEVAGAGIELLAWGEVGRPGLMLVHGNTAHADWWSFIAPFFADTHRVAALSLSGMGESDWREAYDFETFADEIHQAGQAAGLYEGGARPAYVGHSFGGSQVYYSAFRHPERMSACLLVDAGLGGPPSPKEAARREREAVRRGEPAGRWRLPAFNSGPHRVYPTLEAALARFRLMPPQIPGNLYIADFIARRSLKRVPLAGEAGEGWTWKFDPALWAKLDRDGFKVGFEGVRPPLAHIHASGSAIVARSPGDPPDPLPAGTPRIVIPESAHHIMVDQPLALVAALRAVIALMGL